MGSTADLPTATHHSTPPWGRPRSASEQEPGEAWTEVKVADRVVGCTQPVLRCSFLFIRLRPAGLDHGVWQGPFVGSLLAKPLCKAGTGLPEPVFTGGGKGSLSGVSTECQAPGDQLLGAAESGPSPWPGHGEADTHVAGLAQGLKAPTR